MPGKIKVKTFCLLPSSLSHVTQRAPYPRPAVAHFQRIPKHGVGEPFNGLCFAGFKKKTKKQKEWNWCWMLFSRDSRSTSWFTNTDWGTYSKPPAPFSIAWKKYQLYGATHERMPAMSTTSLSPKMRYLHLSFLLTQSLTSFGGRKLKTHCSLRATSAGWWWGANFLLIISQTASTRKCFSCKHGAPQ